MKTGLFIIGLTVGVIIGFCLTKMFHSSSATTPRQSSENAVTTADKMNSAKWLWADSLDAVEAALNLCIRIVIPV
jgi:gas vesicle protein